MQAGRNKCKGRLGGNKCKRQAGRGQVQRRVGREVQRQAGRERCMMYWIYAQVLPALNGRQTCPALLWACGHGHGAELSTCGVKDQGPLPVCPTHMAGRHMARSKSQGAAVPEACVTSMT